MTDKMTKEKWLEHYGSERLKLGIAQGYPMKELFLEEFIDKTLNIEGLVEFEAMDFAIIKKLDSPTLPELNLQSKAAKILNERGEFAKSELSLVEGERWDEASSGRRGHFLRLENAILPYPLFAEVGNE